MSQMSEAKRGHDLPFCSQGVATVEVRNAATNGYVCHSDLRMAFVASLLIAWQQ